MVKEVKENLPEKGPNQITEDVNPEVEILIPGERSKKREITEKVRVAEECLEEKTPKRSSSEEVNDVHYSKYCRGTLIDNSEVINDAIKHFEECDREFIEHVYKEGNYPYKLVVDWDVLKQLQGVLGWMLLLSPWSNGENERNYYTCDVVVDKLMEDDPNLTLEEAVSHSVNAKNLQITRKGFGPRQLMFGHQGVIPGITDGNPAIM